MKQPGTRKYSNLKWHTYNLGDAMDTKDEHIPNMYSLRPFISIDKGLVALN